LVEVNPDSSDPHYPVGKNNMEALKNIKDAKGRRLELEFINEASYHPEVRDDECGSYINSYLANGAVVVPGYNANEGERDFEECQEPPGPGVGCVSAGHGPEAGGAGRPECGGCGYDKRYCPGPIGEGREGPLCLSGNVLQVYDAPLSDGAGKSPSDRTVVGIRDERKKIDRCGRADAVAPITGEDGHPSPDSTHFPPDLRARPARRDWD